MEEKMIPGLAQGRYKMGQEQGFPYVYEILEKSLLQALSLYKFSLENLLQDSWDV